MTYTLAQIRTMLETQSFANWHSTTFENYITGEEDISSERINTELASLLP